MTNIDPTEVQKFNQVAHKWWDEDSEFKPLHEINPLRLGFIAQHVDISDKTVLDVGCGGGILSEAMAKQGAAVTGIDMATKSLKVAQLHALESEVAVNYQQIAVEEMAKEKPQSFDVVTCMELLEHVPSPESVVAACAELVKPGGWVFFSTLNRNPKAYLLAVIGAEYVLNMLTRGTHDYKKFIKPSELARMARNGSLMQIGQSGLSYNPLTKIYALTPDMNVNYMVAMQKI